MEIPKSAPDYCPDCGTSLVEKEYDGRERLFCNKCDQIVWMNPKPAAGMIIQRDNKFLLQKRKIQPHKGKWSIPAGFLEIEETPRKAAKRELKEETNLEVKGEPEFIGDINLEHPDGKRVLVSTFKSDYYDCDGEMKPEKDEVEELEFLPLEKIKENKEKLDYEDYIDLIEESIS